MARQEKGRQKHIVNSVADRNTEMTQRVLRMARQTEAQHHFRLQVGFGLKRVVNNGSFKFENGRGYFALGHLKRANGSFHASSKV